jgi:hypothetical protein
VSFQQVIAFPLLIVLNCAWFPRFPVNFFGVLLGCFFYGQCVVFVQPSLTIGAIACNGLPFVWVLYVALSGAVVLTIRRWRRVGQYSAGQCAKCGYLLQGLPSTRCPECGTVAEIA